jgi:hypothetical protein
VCRAHNGYAFPGIGFSNTEKQFPIWKHLTAAPPRILPVEDGRNWLERAEYRRENT